MSWVPSVRRLDSEPVHERGRDQWPTTADGPMPVAMCIQYSDISQHRGAFQVFSPTRFQPDIGVRVERSIVAVSLLFPRFLMFRKQASIGHRPFSALPPLPGFGDGRKSELPPIVTIMFQTNSKLLCPIFVGIPENTFINMLQSSLENCGLDRLSGVVHGVLPILAHRAW